MLYKVFVQHAYRLYPKRETHLFHDLLPKGCNLYKKAALSTETDDCGADFALPPHEPESLRGLQAQATLQLQLSFDISHERLKQFPIKVLDPSAFRLHAKLSDCEGSLCTYS